MKDFVNISEHVVQRELQKVGNNCGQLLMEIHKFMWHVQCLYENSWVQFAS